MLRQTDEDVIRKVHYMRKMDPGVFKDLARSISAKDYAAGFQVFEKGMPAGHFYIVISGWIALYRLDSSGKKTTVKLMGPGESFAEALIPEGSVYPLSAEVLSKTRLASVSTEHFRRIIRSDPETSINVLSATFQQLRILVDRIEQDAGWSCERRIARFLLKCHADAGSKQEFKLPLEQKVIAEFLSMSPYTFSRKLAKMQKLGINTRRGYVKIEDLSRLSEIANGTLDYN
ncbi:MAG: Crp/Fnr family transcriptional regulator [Pseudomonadota bacterium]